jgi:hypothetical protein
MEKINLMKPNRISKNIKWATFGTAQPFHRSFEAKSKLSATVDEIFEREKMLPKHYLSISYVFSFICLGGNQLSRI